MLNVIVWGNQEQYDLFINQIKAEELKGNICVKGVVSEDCAWSNKIDEYEMIDKKVLLQELGGGGKTSMKSLKILSFAPE